jgi:F-type H+-transporting ATPase subunit a
MIHTSELSSKIVDAINVNTAFTIPIFGGIKIAESIVVMWLVMGVIMAAALLMTRNLSVENPSRKQLALEMAVTKIYNFFYRLVGENGKAYIPYFMCLMTFIGVSDLFPLLGFKPPTKDLSVTATLAGISIVLVEYAGIRAKGGKGWLKSFTEPIALVTPLNFLEILIKPFSLCMRLMGNMLGGFAIMELIKYAVPAVVPAFASLYFDIFDGLLQAFVFTFLTALYIQEATAGEDAQPPRERIKKKLQSKKTQPAQA